MRACFSAFAPLLSPLLIRAVSIPDWSLVFFPSLWKCRHEADFPASTSALHLTGPSDACVCVQNRPCMSHLFAPQRLASAASGSVMRDICNQATRLPKHDGHGDSKGSRHRWMAEEERWRGDKLFQQDADVAVRNAWSGESPLRSHTFTCEETSACLWCCHFHTFLLFLFGLLSPSSCSVFFLSYFVLLLSCLLACCLSLSLALCPVMPCFVKIKKITEDAFFPHDLVQFSQWACSLCPSLFSFAVVWPSSLFLSW